MLCVISVLSSLVCFVLRCLFCFFRLQLIWPFGGASLIGLNTFLSFFYLCRWTALLSISIVPWAKVSYMSVIYRTEKLP